MITAANDATIPRRTIGSTWQATRSLRINDRVRDEILALFLSFLVPVPFVFRYIRNVGGITTIIIAIIVRRTSIRAA